MHAGSLERTEEARVALDYASSNSALSRVLSAKLSACIHNSSTHANGMNQFLKDGGS